MRKLVPLLVLGLALASLVTGCGGKQESAGTDSPLTGVVRVDGSSTVFPITEAVGEEFQRLHGGVRVTVGISGTGGGFKRFVVGETDINDASRPIKPSEEATAAEHGVASIELPVAFDGLSVLVNPANTWVDHLTVDELKRIWQAGSTVKTWRDLRTEWPAEPITLYGPDTDSGTFDYFTETVTGEGSCRPDYTASADDNVLVTGIAGDKHALGYFGYAYYVENKDKLKLVPIDGGGGAGPVAPSELTINNGSYAPLSRPLFIYVSAAAAERREVQAFVKFYLEQAGKLAAEVGYVALPASAYELAGKRYAARTTGSLFGGEAAKSGQYTITQLLGR
jgi:phosphate transport system substrate-binding protein